MQLETISITGYAQKPNYKPTPITAQKKQFGQPITPPPPNHSYKKVLKQKEKNNRENNSGGGPTSQIRNQMILVKDMDVTKLMNDQKWVDRLAKELKCQKQWSDKWGFISDPKLYLGEENESYKPKTPPPSKWSAYSIVNPPKNNPLTKPIPPPENYIPPCFKITHDPKTGNPLPHTNASYHHSNPTTRCSTPQKIHEQAPFGIYLNTSSLNNFGPKNRNRGYLSTYNSFFVANGGGKEMGPKDIYKYPPTTSNEYGWHWNGRKTLEIYGSTNAKNF